MKFDKLRRGRSGDCNFFRNEIPNLFLVVIITSILGENIRGAMVFQASFVSSFKRQDFQLILKVFCFDLLLQTIYLFCYYFSIQEKQVDRLLLPSNEITNTFVVIITILSGGSF